MAKPADLQIEQHDIVIGLSVGNAAFTPEAGPEIARILRDLANRFENLGSETAGEIALRDVNGNMVGFCEFDWSFFFETGDDDNQKADE